MSVPEEVEFEAARAALERLRRDGGPAGADDESLAAFIEGGIDAVRPADRAALLRAIGSRPEVAATVADLVPTRPMATQPDVVWGVSRGAWRFAWAACTLMTLGLSVWALSGQGSAPGDVALLDGSAGAVEVSSFREWFEGRPLHVTLGSLWLVMCLLAIPSMAPTPQRRIQSSGSRPRGSL